MPEGKKSAASKSVYGAAARNLRAIWKVLREYATPQKPLGTADICDKLKKLENPPADAAVKRLFPKEKELMEALFPGTVTEAGECAAAEAYAGDGALHIVLETPAGEVLREGGMEIEACAAPYTAPSAETVEALLRAGLSLQLDTFPYRLRCVARIRGSGGRVRFVPFEEEQEKEGRERLYYLSSALTESERGVLAEMIAVYPLISQAQANTFMRAVSRMCAEKPRRLPERFAPRQNAQALFALLRVLDKAIEQKKKLMLVCGEYTLRREENGVWRSVLAQRRKNGLLEFEPYALMWTQNGYVLVGKNRGLTRLQVDHILEAKLLDASFEPPESFDAACAGEPLRARLRCKLTALDALADAFGQTPKYSAPNANGMTVDVALTAPREDIKTFALRNLEGVEVLEPAVLRAELMQALQKAAAHYSK